MAIGTRREGYLVGQNVVPASGYNSMGGFVVDTWRPAATGTRRPVDTPVTTPVNNAMFSNPFGTAMSGTQTGTLQPYVNRMTQNASNALYGGLLGYSPQSLIAGDAGGTPVNSTAPQWNLPSAIGGTGQGLNFTNFGNRAWMNQGG